MELSLLAHVKRIVEIGAGILMQMLIPSERLELLTILSIVLQML